MLEQEI